MSCTEWYKSTSTLLVHFFLSVRVRFYLSIWGSMDRLNEIKKLSHLPRPSDDFLRIHEFSKAVEI